MTRLRGRRGRRLVATVVHNFRQELRATASQLHLGLLGRFVLSWPTGERWLWLLVGGRMAWGCERAPGRAVLGEHGVSTGFWVPGKALAEDIRDGWKAVVRLRGGYVVDMRRVGEF